MAVIRQGVEQAFRWSRPSGLHIGAVFDGLQPLRYPSGRSRITAPLLQRFSFAPPKIKVRPFREARYIHREASKHRVRAQEF
jgi:hypothetical protein